MAEPKKVGDWSAASFEGGINANLDHIMKFLQSGGKNGDTAKIVEGTDQAGKPISVVFMKH